jgi:drug/metabolite transporter (DMT)-like permease
LVEVITPIIPSFALTVTSYVYLAVGLTLGFLGRAIWGRLMTLVGIILGAAIGYNVGALIIPGLPALALALVGAILGSMVFSWLVEVALAGMAGALALYVTYRSFLEYVSPDDALIVGILSMLVVFSLTFYYMERLMSYVTALIGAVLAGVGLFLLTSDLQLSGLVAAAVAILGSALQELVIKRHEEKIRRAMRRPVAAMRRR